jgi:hypothetical protein
MTGHSQWLLEINGVRRLRPLLHSFDNNHPGVACFKNLHPILHLKLHLMGVNRAVTEQWRAMIDS